MFLNKIWEKLASFCLEKCKGLTSFNKILTSLNKYTHIEILESWGKTQIITNT